MKPSTGRGSARVVVVVVVVTFVRLSAQHIIVILMYVPKVTLSFAGKRWGWGTITTSIEHYYYSFGPLVRA